MDLKSMKPKEVFELIIGLRKPEETAKDYLIRLNKQLMKNLDEDFYGYHRQVNIYLKEIGNPAMWDLYCAHIAGFEKYWIKALYALIVDNYPESITNKN